MKLKPKSTVRNCRGLLYKRYTQIEKSVNTSYIYYTTQDRRYWVFDYATQEFKELIDADIKGAIVISVSGATQYQYLTTIYHYEYPKWVKTNTDYHGVDFDLAQRLKNSVNSKYQINKYYYSGSFDFIIKGSITGSTTQYLKGNIVPTVSMNIKHYNDYIDLQTDDLVVVDNQLYAVESVELDHKHQPKDFKIYMATLNNIL